MMSIEKLKKVLDRWKGRRLSMRGKVLVVKVLGLSKLEYVGRVLEAPGDIIREVNKVVWGFLWGGKVELIKRGTCLLPFNKGGFGVVDWGVRLKALHVACVVSLLRRNSCKASAFVRYFVGNRVCFLVDGLGHLHTNLLPNADVLPSYYSHVVSALRTVSVKSDCTVKSVYSLLVQPLLVPPRCEVFWNGCVGNVQWSRVWKGVWSSEACGVVSEIRWRAIHRVTKVREKLKKWGCNVTSDRCAACGKVESIEHCFLECDRVKKAWGWVMFVLRGIVPRDFRIDVRNVFLCLFYRGRREDRVMLFVIETMLSVIWMFRNRATFDNYVVPYIDLIRTCKFDVRTRLTADRFRMSDVCFRETWGAGNVLVSQDLSIIM